MKRRAFLATSGVGISVGLAGCLPVSGGPDHDGDVEVQMTIDSFRPEELTIPPETTVAFVNTSNHGHTVTGTRIPDEADDTEYFASGGFDSEDEAWDGWEEDNGGIFTQGEWYENEFVTPGTYEYICIPHIRVDMRGKIHVDPDAE